MPEKQGPFIPFPYILMDIPSYGRRSIQFVGDVDLTVVRESLNGLVQEGRLTPLELERNLQAVRQIEETVTGLLTNGGLLNAHGTLIHQGIDDIPLPEPLSADLQKQGIICAQAKTISEGYSFNIQTVPAFEALSGNNWAVLISKDLRQMLYYVKTPGNSLDFNYVPITPSVTPFNPHKNFDRVITSLEKHFRNRFKKEADPPLVTPRNIMERTLIGLCKNPATS